MSNFYVVDDQSRRFAVLQSETLFLWLETNMNTGLLVYSCLKQILKTANMIILSNIGS